MQQADEDTTFNYQKKKVPVTLLFWSIRLQPHQYWSIHLQSHEYWSKRLQPHQYCLYFIIF